MGQPHSRGLLPVAATLSRRTIKSVGWFGFIGATPKQDISFCLETSAVPKSKCFIMKEVALHGGIGA